MIDQDEEEMAKEINRDNVNMVTTLTRLRPMLKDYNTEEMKSETQQLSSAYQTQLMEQPCLAQ